MKKRTQRELNAFPFLKLPLEERLRLSKAKKIGDVEWLMDGDYIFIKKKKLIN